MLRRILTNNRLFEELRPERNAVCRQKHHANPADHTFFPAICPTTDVTDMMKLYYAPGACSLASHIALEEAKAPYTIQRVDLKAGEQRSPEYLELNPKGRVP